MKNIYYNRKTGFTIIELLIVISIIGILSTIGIVSFVNIQVGARDTQRSSRINIIAEELEKYFDKNGEYPSCTAMTATPTTIATSTLSGLDTSNLSSPSATAGDNSITGCVALSNNGADNFAYLGDGGTCVSSTPCLNYELQYIEESTGEVKTVSSRRSANLASLTKPVASAITNSSSQITLSWNSVSMAQNYDVDISTVSDFSTKTSTLGLTSLSKVFSGLNTGIKYYFRVKANADSFISTTSNTVDTITTVNAPTAPSTSVYMSIIYAFGDTSTVTCAAGTTVMYATQTNINDGAWSGWSAWTSTLPSIYQDTNQGWKYGFMSKAKCQGVDTESTESIGAAGSTIRAIDQPAAPGWLGPAHFHDNVHAVVTYAAYCPVGTWAINGTFWSDPLWSTETFTHGWGYNDWWGSGGIGSSVIYRGKYQCTSSYITSVLSPESYNRIYVYT